MSEGKFSQPRPYRDEDRQIEESFRQLTEDNNRRKKKAYHVEEDIQKTVREISAVEVSLPEEDEHPFQRSAQLEQTILAAPEQQPQRKPVPPVRQSQRAPQYDLLPEDPDSFFENSASAPPIPETEDSYRQEEPDFIDKLMHFGDFFCG